MTEEKICRFVTGLKKDIEEIKVEIPGGVSFSFVVKDHKSGNPRRVKVLMDCPKSLDIKKNEVLPK